MNYNKFLQISSLSSNNNINFGNNNNFNNTFPRIELNNYPSPNFDKDDSFKYSNYLIDNLKNTINNVDFQKNLTNLV